MKVHSLEFKGYSCFKDYWSAVPSLKPICVIIGKNNTGKSHYLNFLAELCVKKVSSIGNENFLHKSKAILNHDLLKRIFPKGSTDSRLYGDSWEDNGRFFVDQEVVYDSSQSSQAVSFLGKFDPSNVGPVNSPDYTEQRLLYIEKSMTNLSYSLEGKIFRKMLADRDVQPEIATSELNLSPNGNGATNIIRRFLTNVDNVSFPRDLILKEMLDALNLIFRTDGYFSEIVIQQQDETSNLWEIYLHQEHKGLVSLSNSGSSLKTVFLVLLNILVIPKIEGKRLNEYAYAFEELENNLHPSLLRRLLEYIEGLIREEYPFLSHSDPVFFLTTHSNVTLDYFSGQKHSQIIHITHDGKSAKAEVIDQNRNQLQVLRDIGSKPSDLLQANGVIWVEGPSDRIYINKWISLWSEGEFEEGRHYQCMFYGGGLLANIEVVHLDEESDEAIDDPINLLTINPNVIIVTDSDKKSLRAHLKPRVKRIIKEFENLDVEHAFHWLLEAREIENYLTGDLVNYALSKKMTPPVSPDKFESFFEKKGEESYLKKKAGRLTMDKSDLARKTVSHMTKEALSVRFDLDKSMQKIISLIRSWNE